MLAMGTAVAAWDIPVFTFNSLFEMHVKLVFRTVEECISTFNSLFEMLQDASGAFSDAVIELSILYLRCRFSLSLHWRRRSS